MPKKELEEILTKLIDVGANMSYYHTAIEKDEKTLEELIDRIEKIIYKPE